MYRKKRSSFVKKENRRIQRQRIRLFFGRTQKVYKMYLKANSDNGKHD